MEIAGKPHNLTRESVRQILNKYKDALIVHKSAFEALKKAAAILEKIAPVSAESAEAILAEAGLIEPGFKVEGLINASNFLTVRKGGNELSIVKEKSFWSDTSSRYVVTTKFEDLLHHNRRQAQARFVQQQQLGPAHQCAGDGEHLLDRKSVV